MIGRVLAFLTLFAGGLLVLFELTDAQLPTELRPLDPPRALSESPGLMLDDPGTVSAVLIPSGRLQYTKALPSSSGWSRRFEIRAPASRMVADGGVLLEELELQLFDPESEELFVLVRAREGRTELMQGSDSLRPQLSNRIELSGVTLTLLSGTRLVPLELTTERLTGDLDAGRFETDAYAEINGSGLEASGQGLSLDLSEGLARFTRQAECLVAGAGALSGRSEGSGRIASAGPLSIQRLDAEQSDLIELIARERALLAVEGPDGLRLSAREIRLRGRSDEQAGSDAGGQGSLRLESLSGDGDVTLVMQGHEFTAERARLRAGEAGGLAEARLEGSPSAWLRIDPPDELARGPAEELVRVWGESRMVLDWEPSIRFSVSGPANLSWRGTSLFAAGGISGSPPLEDSATFHAWTGVLIDYDGWRIRTEELDGRIEIGADGGEAEELWLEAEADTVIEGTIAGVDAMRLRAVRGLSFRGDEQGWKIPEARGVQLSLPGERALDATADRLLDFDPQARSFRAEGGVEVTDGDTTLRGGTLVSEGPERLTVSAEGRERVTLDTEGTLVEALRLERSAQRVVAEGEVRAQLEFGESVAVIEADQMELVGAALAEDPEERTRGRTSLTATGDVRTRIEQGVERYDLQGDSLWLERRPIEAGVASMIELRMVGSVVALADSGLGRFRVRSRELEGLLLDSDTVDGEPKGLDEDTDGQLLARGDVWLETLDERALSARAERLTLLPGGRALLEPAPGGQVSVAGRLPRQRRPFELIARTVDARPDRLEAERPKITLLPPFEEGVETPLDGLRASGDRLTVTEERLELTGDVSVIGRTPNDKLWSLYAQSTVFEGSTVDGGRLALARMRAEGQVEIEFSDGPRATGDRLIGTTWSGRIRLEGEPAMVYLRGHATGSTWFEFDTSDFLLRGGPGWIGSPSEDGR